MQSTLAFVQRAYPQIVLPRACTSLVTCSSEPAFAASKGCHTSKQQASLGVDGMTWAWRSLCRSRTMLTSLDMSTRQKACTAQRCASTSSWICTSSRCSRDLTRACISQQCVTCTQIYGSMHVIAVVSHAAGAQHLLMHNKMCDNLISCAHLLMGLKGLIAVHCQQQMGQLADIVLQINPSQVL